MKKTCNKCGETKLLEDFPKKKDNKDGRHGSCKVCESKRKAKYQYTTEEWSHWRRKKKFGVTEEDYQTMLERQQYKCGICDIHLDQYVGIHGNGKKVNSFSIDHCHTTGKIRGLLCFRCNLALGYAQDNPSILEKAASYIRERQ